MQVLQTIEEVHKVFDTQGSSPLLVTCEDLRDWVCKYDRFPKYLFNELIASEFAKLWDIKTPETSFIKVKSEHVPIDKFPQLQSMWFEKECFGSLYLENSKEIDHSIISMFEDKSFRSKLSDKTDFLKIALFDIWMANEDRNYNNFNLLLYVSSEKLNFFYAIDHVNIFNTSFLDYGIAELTEDDSIIKTDLAKILFGKNKKLTEIVNNLIQKFYLCTEKCQDKLDEILDLVPESWNINKEQIRDRIIQSLFSDEWKAQCEANFRGFVQSFIKN
ncbi:HipA family kinase [Flavobacterium sp. MMLR14_040]|uniref:HipA family kinase n=1 Tax=Flavobacterium sp. MMLR14_040 TaxID=3093843 RepID=UPI00298F85B3|nr:HipA family kinase [Flavobacterium sp. MMLR14_040]MDW8850987.1 HipA family kinase [Flavobacterium sp. MMLR14_040]